MTSGRLLLLGVVAATGLGWLLAGSEPPMASTTTPACGDAVDVGGIAGFACRAPGPAPAPLVASASASASTAPAAPRPASLRGTRPDGALAVGPDGRFHASIAARLAFDYWLSTAGEEPAAATRARIVAEIARRLPASAAADAVALLDRYLTYRDRAVDVGPADDPLARLDALHLLRVDVFGAADAAAMFGDEEARERATLARRAALADASLTPAERAAAVADADEALPPDARATRDAATLPLRLAEAEAATRAEGGDVQALRESMVGPEAATRLAALDRERAAWDARLADYRAARAAIVADPALDAAERARRIAALQAARFSDPERMRVAALDRLAGLTP